MMQEQDTHLDSMSGTLVNLKEIAGTMNTELEDQAMWVLAVMMDYINQKADRCIRILDDLGDHVDRSQGRLKRAMNRVTYILKKEEGKVVQGEWQNDVLTWR